MGMDSIGRESGDGKKRPIRTLVVDDSALIRKTVELRLRKVGHEVTTAEDGEEAFRQAMNAPFDLVVSDVTMGAISGVHLCRMLRSDPHTRDLPIVLLTGEDDPRSRFWGRSAGADAYIGKGQMATGLLPAIERVLERRPPGEARQMTSRSVDPLARLSEVLDRHLYDAVVMSEAQRLMDHVSERREFCERALDFLGDVIGCAYAVLRIEGANGDESHALLARAPCPEPISLAVRGAIALPPPIEPLAVLRKHDPRHAERPTSGETYRFAIEAGGERLGELALYGGHKGVSAQDERTATIVARTRGPVVKSMLLLEDTRRLATTDALTGLANRRRTTERLQEEMRRAARHGVPLSVLLCDIDRFKSVNDTYGHNAGDEVLRAVATALGCTLREVDMVGRWGGEEFLTILPDTGLAGAAVAAERVRAAIEALPAFEDGPASVTTSVGVAAYVRGIGLEAFVERADKALYEAKESGRNCVILAPAEDEPSADDLETVRPGTESAA